MDLKQFSEILFPQWASSSLLYSIIILSCYSLHTLVNDTGNAAQSWRNTDVPGKETNIENDVVETSLKQYKVGCWKYLSEESRMPNVL